MGKPDIINEFLNTGGSGFYLKVTTEGMVGVEDKIKLLDVTLKV